MEFNLLDYSLIIILALSVLIGYTKGFIGAVGGIVTTLVSLGIAYLYRNAAADYLQEHYEVVSSLTALLEKRLSIPTGGQLNQTDIISSLPLVDEGVALIHRQITEIAYLLVAVLCFLLLYIVSRCLLNFMCMLIEKVLQQGIIGRVNRVGGIVIILTQNLIIIAVIAGLLSTPLELGADLGMKNASQLAVYMEESVTFPYLLKIFALLKAFIGIGV